MNRKIIYSTIPNTLRAQIKMLATGNLLSYESIVDHLLMLDFLNARGVFEKYYKNDLIMEMKEIIFTPR